VSATKWLLLDAVTPTWQDQLSVERAAQFERFAELVCVA